MSKTLDKPSPVITTCPNRILNACPCQDRLSCIDSKADGFLKPVYAIAAASNGDFEDLYLPSSDAFYIAYLALSRDGVVLLPCDIQRVLDQYIADQRSKDGDVPFDVDELELIDESLTNIMRIQTQEKG